MMRLLLTIGLAVVTVGCSSPPQKPQIKFNGHISSCADYWDNGPRVKLSIVSDEGALFMFNGSDLPDCNTFRQSGFSHWNFTVVLGGDNWTNQGRLGFYSWGLK